jgi:tetratricopeptide (TPR) repeat protein
LFGEKRKIEIGEKVMFNNSVRLILSVIFLSLAIYLFLTGRIQLGVLFVVPIIFLKYGYFRYGSVWSAFKDLKKGRNDKAEKLINPIKYPDLLTKQQKGFYFFTKAIIEQDKENFDEAEFLYLKALELRVRTKNNEAIINFNLAKIYNEKNLTDSARERLQKAISFFDKKELDIEIEKLSLQLET